MDSARGLGPAVDARPMAASLADTINHEFRNPLATLMGHLELLREHESELPAELSFSVAAMERAGHRLSDLVAAAADIAEVTQTDVPQAV